MQTSSYVLTAYPISQSFRKKVDAIAGPDATCLMVAQLRHMGLAGMVRFLRGIDKSATMYIPLEDTYSEALLPVLLGLAALRSGGRNAVIAPDTSVREVGHVDLAAALAKVALSTIAGFVALIRTWLAVRWLARCPQLAAKSNESLSDILYLNANLWFGVRAGGSVGHIAGVINAFSDYGHRVHLVSANDQVMLRSEVRQTLLSAPKAFGFPYELNYFRYNLSVIRALSSLAGKGYRFCYQRMSVMNYAGVAFSRALQIPLILEYNGSEVWIAKNWGRGFRFAKLALAIEDLCLRQAHRIVVVSEALKEELLGRGVEESRIVCYPNCVDPDHYDPNTVTANVRAEVRTAMQVPSDAVLATFVGTFGQWHGASVLATAIKHLVDHEREWLERNRLRFALVGDGLKMPEVRELIGSDEYRPWVVFTGLIPQAQTVGYLAASDILISPHVRNADGSKFFGSPTKLFEYMAMGKGIIASDLDQIGQVLSAGIRIWKPGDSPRTPTAVLIQPGNVPDLTAALHMLVESPALLARLGKNARAEVLAKYTWRHHVTAILHSVNQPVMQRTAPLAAFAGQI